MPGAKLRVDANGGWTLDEATVAIRELVGFDLEYVEQPCAGVEDLAALRRLDLGAPIAADESIRRADDPIRVRDMGAADVSVLKVQPIGGIRACLALADELGMPVVVSSAVETSIGLRVGVALAAALPELPFACGLETGRLLAGDLTREPVVPVDGEIAVRDVVVEPGLLVEHAAGPELTRFWLDRLHRVREHLEAQR